MGEEAMPFRSKRYHLIFSFLLAISIIVASSLSEGAEIYKWVDENGVVHFSDTPPPDKKPEIVPEASVQKIGGSETKSQSKSIKKGSRDAIGRKIDTVKEEIERYEKRIERYREEIAKYTRKIEEVEEKKRNLPSHFQSHSEGEYYYRLKKRYDSIIEEYQAHIRSTMEEINQYSFKTTDLRNELNELAITASLASPE